MTHFRYAEAPLRKRAIRSFRRRSGTLQMCGEDESAGEAPFPLNRKALKCAFFLAELRRFNHEQRNLPGKARQTTTQTRSGPAARAQWPRSRGIVSAGTAIRPVKRNSVAPFTPWTTASRAEEERLIRFVAICNGKHFQDPGLLRAASALSIPGYRRWARGERCLPASASNSGRASVFVILDAGFEAGNYEQSDRYWATGRVTAGDRHGGWSGPKDFGAAFRGGRRAAKARIDD